MRASAILLLTGSLLMGGCGREAPHQEKSPANKPAVVSSTGENEAAAPAPDQDGPESAAAVVQNYGALLEQKRWSEANALWGDTAAAGKFESALSQFADVHLESGNPGDPEGAAGSIYITVPAIIYGDTRQGQPFRRSADVILRRVNDVPGSTEAQRRWHIERIDWAS
jgi:hypothetical protein